MLKLFGESLLNLFFPQKCLNCGNFSETEFCDFCFQQIRKPPFIEFHELSGLSALISFGYYENFLQRLIRNLKFHRQIHLAKNFGRLLAEEFQKYYDVDVEKDFCLMPVPLFPTKERERGFNQSFLIAKEIGRKLNLEVKRNLVRVEDTPALYTLSRHQRQKILKSAFGFDGENKIKNKNIILVDDIYTTGATLFNAALTLKKAGSQKVIGLTLARA